MSRKLRELILDPATRNTHFFNGRLLSADALQAEQMVQRHHRALLGGAIGAGVVSGLAVTIIDPAVKHPTLRITRGVAINAAGKTLALGDDIDLELARALDELTTEAGAFAACPPETLTAIPTGTGIYILLAVPAFDYSVERVPASGLGADGRMTGCGSRYEDEGVRFRMVKLVPDDVPGLAQADRDDLKALMMRIDQARLAKPPRDDLPDVSLLRNRLAHLCLGDSLATAAAPLIDGHWQAPARRGLLDRLVIADPLDRLTAERRLSRCDVPLALVYWTADGVRFVDMWSVRRSPAPAPLCDAWPLGLLGTPAAGEARLRQFAEQLAWLLDSLAANKVADAQAVAYFRYLAPAGLVQLAGVGKQIGFVYEKFFDGIPHRNYVPPSAKVPPPVTGMPTLEAAAVEALLRAAASYPPLDLAAVNQDGVPQRELIWLFRVRQNRQAIDESKSGPPQAYALFTSGHLPEIDEARYSRARAGYSNFT